MLKRRQPLGANQRAVLRLMKANGGFWHLGCGWMIGSPSGMRDIMESLVNRDLVTCPKSVSAVVRYELIKQGEKE